MTNRSIKPSGDFYIEHPDTLLNYFRRDFERLAETLSLHSHGMEITDIRIGNDISFESGESISFKMNSYHFVVNSRFAVSQTDSEFKRVIRSAKLGMSDDMSTVLLRWLVCSLLRGEIYGLVYFHRNKNSRRNDRSTN